MDAKYILLSVFTIAAFIIYLTFGPSSYCEVMEFRYPLFDFC